MKKRSKAADEVWKDLAITNDLVHLIRPIVYAIPNYSEKLQDNFIGALDSLSVVISERISGSLEKLENL
jgi:hypothetical protein